ncbi:MAG: DUF2510 domain-containing protein [Actinomyces sp.]|uniref:DUF2510 domain-containing protein n=1 Tax=Actinomyces sp. TaxID=29317 RepID=UPI0028FE41D6|nr:DUF2510 domain-containing protein [Actinomyces sp.]MDU2258846.1 DUF2510 domain-containing protein [Actinomyces sp.]
MTNPQAGWYSDPSNPSQLRWWDGTQWTNNTQAAQGAAQASAPQRPVTTTSSSYSAVPQSPLAANSGSAQAHYQAQQGGYPPAQGGIPGTYPSQQPVQGAPLAAGGFPPRPASYTGAPTTGGFPPRPASYTGAPATASTIPASPMAPAKPKKPKAPKKPRNKQKTWAIIFTVLSVLFIVLGFLFLGASSRNNARANTVNVELEPARQSISELQKQVDTLNKQLGEAGK